MVTCFLTGEYHSIVSENPTVVQEQLTLVQGQVRAGLRQVEPDLFLLDLGVVDGNVRTLSKEIADQADGGRLASVTGVSLERETKDGDVLQ